MKNEFGDDAVVPPSLQIVQTDDPDGFVRVALRGELDLATADGFSERLRDLKREGRHIRLDFSELSFMDSTGLSVLIPALADASQDGWNLDVDRNVAAQVKRLLDVAGVSQRLWPNG